MNSQLDIIIVYYSGRQHITHVQFKNILLHVKFFIHFQLITYAVSTLKSMASFTWYYAATW